MMSFLLAIIFLDSKTIMKEVDLTITIKLKDLVVPSPVFHTSQLLFIHYNTHKLIIFIIYHYTHLILM